MIGPVVNILSSIDSLSGRAKEVGHFQLPLNFEPGDLMPFVS
jgi:hypothetical protein